MKKATDSQTMSVPVDVLHNGWVSVGGVPDIGLVFVGNCGVIYLELGTNES
jgi:hypothetical protein